MNKLTVALLLTASLFTSCTAEKDSGASRMAGSPATSTDDVTASVFRTEPQPIAASPMFTLRWKSSSSLPAEPGDYPVGSIVSRTPSSALYLHDGDALRLIASTTGREIARAKLPESVRQTHRRLDGRPGMWSDFAYSAYREGGVSRLLIAATQTKRKGTRSGSGVGTALYGCSMDGTVLWTFLGELTHNVGIVPLGRGSDAVLVQQGNNQIVLLAGGNELARVLTPTANSIEIVTEPDTGAVTLLLLGDNLYCYTFGGGSNDRKKDTQPEN